ncbi:MAG: hypothetical protein GY715_04795, partial [Planctomycetes bacterium]|nr:hypothetical protein [Planctomycetota bacterium]
PVKITPGANGGGSMLTCRPMELGEPDESGRRRPVEIKGKDFDVHCDRVLLALGQSAEVSIFPEGTAVHEDENVLGVLQTPVFAAGDLASNEGTVTAAIGSGRRAAFHVHQTFTGEQLLPDPHDDSDVARSDSLSVHLFHQHGADDGETVPARDRRLTYEEVHTGLTDTSEAARCLSCGICNECDRCVTYCPDGVIKRVGHEFIFDYEYCKGCGVCAAECPRQIIFMSRL